MKHITITLAVAVAMATGLLSFESHAQEAKLREHVYYFASDSLRGRKAGSPEGIKAAAYIRDQFSQIGISSFFEDGMSQFFTKNDKQYRNIVGVIEGSHPTLKDEYIVIGAHYDHLGVNSKGEIFNGADDNASGSAVLIELGRMLMASRSHLKRSVILAAFDAEELGLYGSTELANALNEDGRLSKVKLMASIDMVGWYKESGYLEIEGTGTLQSLDDVLRGLASGFDLNLKLKKFEDSMFTATDTEGFAQKQIPTLAITTGTKSPYHKPGDDAELIDYAGMERITKFLSELIINLSRKDDLYASGKVAAKHRNKKDMIEGGLVLGFGNSHVNYPGASVSGKGGFEFIAGLEVKLNLNHFGLSAGVEYQTSNPKFPSSVTEAFTKSAKYNQKALTVPVMAMFQGKNRLFTPYIGVGPYWTHVFEASLDGNKNIMAPTANQFGIQAGFGFEMGHIVMGYYHRWGLSKMLETPPDCNLWTGGLKLGYRF